MKQHTNPRFACPCCESRTLVDLGNYEICDICGWEDDPVQSDDPTFEGGANRWSLNEARAHWQRTKTKLP
ncbi:CPCC family cysteine-rich protein [Paraburkholderia ferrariae]|uniref:CPCC family cysteine-rich protein n=1 Tax=Paraburkholderia ferrariae TaxID=386056 RepID=UPI0009FCC47E|nr:CPCC family cysteine-rich protein [Paraburkholderia ferrariae]